MERRKLKIYHQLILVILLSLLLLDSPHSILGVSANIENIFEFPCNVNVDSNSGRNRITCYQNVTISINSDTCILGCLFCEFFASNCELDICCYDNSIYNMQKCDVVEQCNLHQTGMCLAAVNFESGNGTGLVNQLTYNGSTIVESDSVMPNLATTACPMPLMTSSSSSLLITSSTIEGSGGGSSSIILSGSTTVLSNSLSITPSSSSSPIAIMSTTSIIMITSSSVTTPTGTSPPDDSEGVSPAVYIAGGGLGGVVILVIVGVFIILCLCLMKRRRKMQTVYEMRNRTTSHNYMEHSPSRQNTSTALQSVVTNSSTLPHNFSPPPSAQLPPTPTEYNSIDELLYEPPPPPPDPVAEKLKRYKTVFGSVTLRPENLHITEEALGEGAFGKVYKGVMKANATSITADGRGVENNIEKEVAVKTLKANPSPEQVEEFVSESAIMLDFDHPNVLKLLGVCFDTPDHLPVIVLPYMANGDLKSFLRNNRKQPNVQYNQFPPNLNHVKLLYMCLDIAKGMAYLAKKKFVHRDLAARNCIVDSSLSVYVADFGLSRDVYSRDYYRMGIKAAKLPVKWMSPESLGDGLYGEKSDVWAFGVTCWEIFSLGRSPYPAIDNAEVLDHIESGARLKKPALCETSMYEVMLSCWTLEADDRATFEDLVDAICTLLRESSVLSDDTTPSHNYFTLEEALDEVKTKRNEIFQDTEDEKSHTSPSPPPPPLNEDHIPFPYSESVPSSLPAAEFGESPMTNNNYPFENELFDDGNYLIKPYAAINEDKTTKGQAIDDDLSQDILSPQPYTLPTNNSSTLSLELTNGGVQ